MTVGGGGGSQCSSPTVQSQAYTGEGWGNSSLVISTNRSRLSLKIYTAEKVIEKLYGTPLLALNIKGLSKTLDEVEVN